MSDKEKRAIYEQYGEEGLKGGIPSSAPSSSSSSSSGGMPGGIRFTSMGGQGGGFQGQDPHVIFSQFFGTSNPFAAFGGMDDMMGGQGGFGGAAFPGMGGAVSVGQRQQKQEPIKHKLNCTLEELYTGTTKKVKITRQRLNPDGKSTRSEEKTIEIPIRPGWKKGTTVTFEKEGDEAPGVVPQDIQFVVSEKEHARFTREGDNLIHVVRLPLADALCGSTLTLATLDGRSLSIPISEVVSPGYIKNIAYEGMPISKEQGKRGDLILRFNIVFPHFVSDSKKLQLRNLLV